jgi:hypothetical protein
MIATPKNRIILDLPRNEITIIKLGKFSKSSERYKYNENQNKCFRKYGIIY